MRMYKIYSHSKFEARNALLLLLYIMLYILYSIMEYYSTMIKKEMLPFATTWMNWKEIKKNKPDRERQIPYVTAHSYVNSKQKKLNLQKQRVGWWLPGAGRRGMGDAGILYFYLQNLATLNLSPHHPNLWPDSDRSQMARQSLWCSLQRSASPGPQGEAEKEDKIWGR